MGRDVLMRRNQSLFSAAAFTGLVLGLGAILVLAKDLFVPIALAILLSFALSPVVRALQYLGAPRALAIMFALAVTIALVAVSIWFLTGQIGDVAARLPAYQTTIESKIHTIADRFVGSGELTRFFAMIEGVLQDIAPTANARNGVDPAQRVVVVEDSPFAKIGAIGVYASPLLAPLVVTALVVLLTGFMLAQREDLRDRLISLIGEKDIKRTTAAIDDAGRRVGRIMFAQLTLNVVYGVGIGIGLWLIGAPNPLLWASLAGVARFIPYFGVAVGLVPTLLVAFAFDPSWKPFLETLALFAVAEPITGQIIEPILYGRSSGLSPVAVVISTAVWAYIWGPIGLVLATPLTVCMVVIGRHSPGLGFIATLLGDEPPLEPHEMFYQRMLAGNPREAWLQAKPFLKERSLAAYLDEIVLDAVRRAHIDVARGDFEPHRLETVISSIRQVLQWVNAQSPHSSGAESAQDTSTLERVSRLAIVHDDQPLDALAASLLAAVLTNQGFDNQILTLSEAQDSVAESVANMDLVYLCFLEPLPLPEMRILANIVRARCPRANIVLCVWGDKQSAALKQKTKSLRVDLVVSDLAAAISAAMRLAMAKRLASFRKTDDRTQRLSGAFGRARANVSQSD